MINYRAERRTRLREEVNYLRDCKGRKSMSSAELHARAQDIQRRVKILKGMGSL